MVIIYNILLHYCILTNLFLYLTKPMTLPKRLFAAYSFGREIISILVKFYLYPMLFLVFVIILSSYIYRRLSTFCLPGQYQTAESLRPSAYDHQQQTYTIFVTTCIFRLKFSLFCHETVCRLYKC